MVPSLVVDVLSLSHFTRSSPSVHSLGIYRDVKN